MSLKLAGESYFVDRRKHLQTKYSDAAFLLPANPETLRNPDVHYEYRQDSTFYYLTGFEEPNAFLFIRSDKTILFCQERDLDLELWNGERYGVERVPSIFGVDEAYPIGTLREKLPELFQESQRIFFELGRNADTDQIVLSSIRDHRKKKGRSGSSLLPIYDPHVALGEMRLLKRPEEISNLKRATEASAKAHLDIMEITRPGMNENDIKIELEYRFKKYGCHNLAYGTIAAGGVNACCLHYTLCNDDLKDGDLLLVDAGGEYDYYAADITRTFPIGKTFSKEQSVIYEIVLESQKVAISSIKPGVRYTTIHSKATEVLADGLVREKIVKGMSSSELIETGKIKRYYPHGTGHYLGMDVHDVGPYFVDESGKRESIAIEQGKVFTIEPGLYFQAYHDEISEKYRGIGIRIEDDVLVNSNGCEILTSGVPKDRLEIEKIRSM